MELTLKQQEGLKTCVERYRNGEPYTTIAGYAGTGKSTLIKFIIDALEFDPESVAYIAYTGKAAQVLRKKGCPNAMTAHRLLYISKQRNDGTFYHIPRNSIGSYKMVVVDEVSMLPEKMWDLLLSHKIYVLACGDPGQLPPIGEETTVLEHPHVFLDEIMRQAAESEIIRLTVDIRERKPIKPYRGSEINIVKNKDFVEGMLPWADQVICGKNATRYELNTYFRKMKWGNDCGVAPIQGDKVICTRNNWDKIATNGDALVNGTIGKIWNIATKPDFSLGTKCIGSIYTGEDDDDWNKESFLDLLIDYKLLTTNEPTVTKENFAMFPKRLRPNLIEYGYVITCHKSQGSEYDKVLVLEEMLKATDHARWLYTACTRAASKLTLVLKD